MTFRCRVNRNIGLVMVAVLVVGCSVVPTSPYDNNTDKALTRLQKQTAEFFVEAEDLAGCEYDNHLDFHQESRVALSGLQVRAIAMADNTLTVEQLEVLSLNYSSLAQLHQLGCFSEAQVEDLWATFDASFSAVLRLELAKKYGRK